MARYKLQMNCGVGGIAWEFEFVAINTNNAIDHGGKCLLSGGVPSSCIAIHLYNHDENFPNTPGNWKRVASFRPIHDFEVILI